MEQEQQYPNELKLSFVNVEGVRLQAVIAQLVKTLPKRCGGPYSAALVARVVAGILEQHELVQDVRWDSFESDFQELFDLVDDAARE